MPHVKHNRGTGLYTISFVTEREVRIGLLPTVVVTIIDTTARPFVWKLKQAVFIEPYTVAVKFLYTMSFSILVSQINAPGTGFCTVSPSDPDTNLMMRIGIDTFPDKFEGSDSGSCSST